MIFAIIVITWFIAGFMTGITSFGGQILAIPVMTTMMGAKDAIVLGCIAGTAVFLSLGLIYFRHILWGETLSLAFFGILGAPLGVYILEVTPPRILLLGAGILIGLFLVWQLVTARGGARIHEVSRYASIPFGLLSGIMMGCLGMGPPALALYAFLRCWQKETTIGGVNMALTLQMAAVILTHWHEGMLNGRMLWDGLWLVASGLIGILLSIPVAKRINILIFRSLLLLMLGVSATMLLIRGVWGG